MNYESIDTEINNIIKLLPAHDENEKQLLELVRDSIINNLTWAYNGQPYAKFNYKKYEKITNLLKELT